MSFPFSPGFPWFSTSFPRVVSKVRSPGGFLAPRAPKAKAKSEREKLIAQEKSGGHSQPDGYNYGHLSVITVIPVGLYIL